MQAVLRAYLLSQGLWRPQLEGLREHSDLHFSDTFCSCYFNRGFMAYSQGKEWISGQKADSFFTFTSSPIADVVSNHHTAWNMHCMHKHASLVAKPLGWKAVTHIYSLILFLSLTLFLSLGSLSFIFPSFPGNLENLYSSFKLKQLLHNSHLGVKNQSQVCITLLWCFLSPLQQKLTAWGQGK